jgi:hypothetical protein
MSLVGQSPSVRKLSAFAYLSSLALMDVVNVTKRQSSFGFILVQIWNIKVSRLQYVGLCAGIILRQVYL